jgi:hypothetical protein
MPDYNSFDEALESIATVGPELNNGMSNHGPMAVEALCAMGRSDAVSQWLDDYRPRLAPPPPRVERVTDHDWRAALCDLRRTTDWFEYFTSQLHERPWSEVLDTWVARLAPGISASATHGIIRTGHAARAMTLEETSTRTRELADGLAYWAASFQTLPTDLSADPAPLRPSQAIGKVEIVPPEQRKFTGTITASLKRLDEFPPFAGTIGYVNLAGDPSITISELTETFARVYLANAHDVLSTIVFIHGVTSVAALRSLLPHLGAETVRAAMRYAWQAGCALYAAFGYRPASASEFERPRESREALIDLAIATGDEHAIKFTEACLREYSLSPSPVYMAAARRAVEMLKRR